MNAKMSKKKTHRNKSKRKKNKWNRTWRNRKLTRNEFANMYWFKCFEFDRFENKWNRCIKIWRNARLYEIKFAIVFVNDFRKKKRIWCRCKSNKFDFSTNMRYKSVTSMFEISVGTLSYQRESLWGLAWSGLGTQSTSDIRPFCTYLLLRSNILVMLPVS